MWRIGHHYIFETARGGTNSGTFVRLRGTVGTFHIVAGDYSFDRTVKLHPKYFHECYAVVADPPPDAPPCPPGCPVRPLVGS